MDTGRILDARLSRCASGIRPLSFLAPNLPQERRGADPLGAGRRARKHDERRGDPPTLVVIAGDIERLSLAIPPPSDATQSDQAGAEEEQRGGFWDGRNRFRIHEHANSPQATTVDIFEPFVGERVHPDPLWRQARSRSAEKV